MTVPENRPDAVGRYTLAAPHVHTTEAQPTLNLGAGSSGLTSATQREGGTR